ncbi:glyoxalase superfamily protein [Primorskyibacter sp. S187A]|uniref:glyoxalase superfamily protein n=1 Tax=Primorskyibacter sp. S187A TaxID=3415130 RepID=UPI003C79CF0E
MTAFALETTIPALRMFDVAKTRHFYVDWLGFDWAWEHRHCENAPLYAGLRLGALELHVTEHYGDCAPGARVMLRVSGLRAFHAALLAKPFRFARPGLDVMPWGLVMAVTDPSFNTLAFTDPGEKA